MGWKIGYLLSKTIQGTAQNYYHNRRTSFQRTTRRLYLLLERESLHDTSCRATNLTLDHYTQHWLAEGCPEYSATIPDKCFECTFRSCFNIRVADEGPQVLVGSRRAALRRGEDISSAPPPGPQKGILVSVPFFHVTGSTSLSVCSSSTPLRRR